MDYRSFYEIQTNVKVPVDFEIHHIDQNRENNTIQNLVAVPSHLHNSYHQFSGIQEHSFLFDLRGTIDIGSGFNEYLLGQASLFVPIWVECKKWIDYRDFLLGKIENIHNINTYEIYKQHQQC